MVHMKQSRPRLSRKFPEHICRLLGAGKTKMRDVSTRAILAIAARNLPYPGFIVQGPRVQGVGASQLNSITVSSGSDSKHRARRDSELAVLERWLAVRQMNTEPEDPSCSARRGTRRCATSPLARSSQSPPGTLFSGCISSWFKVWGMNPSLSKVMSPFRCKVMGPFRCKVARPLHARDPCDRRPEPASSRVYGVGSSGSGCQCLIAEP